MDRHDWKYQLSIIVEKFWAGKTLVMARFELYESAELYGSVAHLFGQFLNNDWPTAMMGMLGRWLERNPPPAPVAFPDNGNRNNA